MMNRKAIAKECKAAEQYVLAGMPDVAARGLSAAYRAAKGVDQDDIKAVAEALGIRFNAEFITG